MAKSEKKDFSNKKNQGKNGSSRRDNNKKNDSRKEQQGKVDTSGNISFHNEVINQPLLTGNLQGPSPDLTSVLGTNTKLTNIGGVWEMQTAVLTLTQDEKELAVSSDTKDLTENLVDAVIADYSSMIGYPLEFNSIEVFEYIQLSNHILALLLTMRRTYNSEHAIDAKGIKFGNIFQMTPEFELSPEVAIINALQGSVGFTKRLTPNRKISNKEWQIMLSVLPKLRLNEILVNRAIAKYDNYYIRPENSNKNIYYQMVPKFGDDIEADFNTSVYDLESLLRNNPNLSTILGLLGFNNEHVVQFDFTRDLKGTKLNVVEDPYFDLMIMNSEATIADNLVHGTIDANSDIPYNAFYDLKGQATPFHFEDRVELPGEFVHAMRSLMHEEVSDMGFRKLVLQPVIMYMFEGDDEVNYEPIMSGIQWNVSSNSPATEQNLNYIRNILQVAGDMSAKGDLILGGLNRFTANVIVTIDISESQDNSISINEIKPGYVIDSGNTYRLPNDFEAYEAARDAELLFGGVPYRTKLQSISSQIIAKPINKQN